MNEFDTEKSINDLFKTANYSLDWDPNEPATSCNEAMQYIYCCMKKLLYVEDRRQTLN